MQTIVHATKKKVEIKRTFGFLVGLNFELDDVCGKVLDQRPLP